MDIENNKPLILMVDDISKNLQLLGNLLDGEDYSLAFATSGAETLKMLENISPDLILLDIMMPEMDGYEVCQSIKANPKTTDIPVIFITGKAEHEDLIKGFKVGATDFVTKPFNAAELLSRVSTHIELKLSRDKLKKYNDELQKLNSTKNKFFSIIAHDLRSPFSGFLGLTQLMNEDLDRLSKEELRVIADNMNKAAVKLYNFLENLLEWSRSQMNTIKIDLQKNNINKIFNDIINISKESLKNKNITLNNNLNEDINLVCDYHTISTAFRNIISNAIKFTPNNGNIIVSSLEDGDFITISIADSGVGIPESQLNTIFEIDKKIVTSGTNKEKGSGLGLLLVKEFVEKNDGKINITSELNRGTKVNITLSTNRNISQAE